MARRCKYGKTRKGSCRKHPRESGFAGAKRTCLKFVCKPGRSPKASKVCDKGEVLRCAQYAPEAGRSPRAGQRKGYAQYIYGRPLPGRSTVREKYPPSIGGKVLPASETISKRVEKRRVTQPATSKSDKKAA